MVENVVQHSVAYRKIGYTQNINDSIHKCDSSNTSFKLQYLLTVRFSNKSATFDEIFHKKTKTMHQLLQLMSPSLVTSTAIHSTQYLG